MTAAWLAALHWRAAEPATVRGTPMQLLSAAVGASSAAALERPPAPQPPHCQRQGVAPVMTAQRAQREVPLKAIASTSKGKIRPSLFHVMHSHI